MYVPLFIVCIACMVPLLGQIFWAGQQVYRSGWSLLVPFLCMLLTIL